MPNTRPLTTTQAALDDKLNRSADHCLVNYGFFIRVTAEVTPQHLLLNTEAYESLGTLAQMNPPLRSPENNQILWQALLDGVIDFIATEHAPHTLEEKAKVLIVLRECLE